MDKVMLVGLIIACIAYPIFVITTIWGFPLYVIICFFLWMFISLGIICLNKSSKISDYIVPVIILDVVFTIIFGNEARSVGFWEENVAMAWFSPSFSLPAICLLGIKIRSWHESRAIRMEVQLRKELETTINQKLETISKFVQLLNKCNMADNSVKKLMTLLNHCLEDSSLINLYNGTLGGIYKNHIGEFVDIIPKEDMPKDKMQFDLYVAQQLKKGTEYRDILNKINTYDYKALKSIYDQHRS